MMKHFSFLKQVLWYSLSAFGGPQGHMGMMLKTFVHKRKDVSEAELLEFISFCNMLPGASSTQTVTLIGYKKGGISLALLTLLIWIFPACFLMGLFSFFIHYLKQNNISLGVFKYVQPMVIGFVMFTASKMFKLSVNNTITRVIVIAAAVVTFLFFKSPWVFPAVIVISGVATNFSSKRIPQIGIRPQKIKWGNLIIFLGIFLIAGYISEMAAKQNWKYKKHFTLFENNYRFGSLVFGGGDVLMPMMYEQYVERPNNTSRDVIKMPKEDLLIGYGIVRAIPGPVFSIGSYTGGIATQPLYNNWLQAIGCVVGGIGIFLPSVLLVLFFYPVWHNLKKYAVIFRSLEGINASIVGIMIGSIFYLFFDAIVPQATQHNYGLLTLNIAVMLASFAYLYFTKYAPPFLVILCLLLGFVF